MGLFRPAVKEQLKGRVALCGPTGAGKTWTALGWATELAQGGKIAFVDTERRSASLYAPHFAFDKMDWAPPYDPNVLIETIRSAEADGYAVLVIDSLTHFWSGEGGTLDVVDNAKNRGSGNSFDAWRVGTPLQRTMVDEILATNMHVIVTMRSKMEYVLEEYEDKGRTKTRPVKIGMAPEQRAGIEYEFTIVADMDVEHHRMVLTKSRCDILADQIIQPHRERDAAKTFLAWLDDGEALASADDRAKLATALRNLDEVPREAARVALTDRFGPAASLKAADIDAALALIADTAMAVAEKPAGDTEPGPEAEPPTDVPTEGSGVVKASPGAAPDAAERERMDAEQEHLAASSDSEQAEEAAERAGASA